MDTWRRELQRVEEEGDEEGFEELWIYVDILSLGAGGGYNDVILWFFFIFLFAI